MIDETTRREFLLGAAAAGVTLAAGLPEANAAQQPNAYGRNARPLERVRIGFVGVGGMGTGHVGNLLKIPGAEIVAVCDIVESRVKRAQDMTEKAGQRRPAGYSRGETDFVRMCETEELDLVYNATPWNWHVPICLAALANGKHAATEVPAALTVEDCWKLVEAAEKTGLYCLMMENCCYGRPELMVLHMARKGLFGKIVHAEAGYMHDLRGVKLGPSGEGDWRWKFSIKMNGNNYPTHGLGPVAQCMNINRGDAFDYLVSMSSPAIGLNQYAQERLKPDDPRRRNHYAQGDVNSSLIKTKEGKTIILQHDCNLPRPYSRINLVQGTKGLFQGYPDRVYIEGRSPAHEWEQAEKFYGEFDHPLWKRMAEVSKGAGHGGMDYIEDYRLIEALRAGTPPDLDVYDAAAWSCIVELSAKSVAGRSKAVDFPDFTRGAWKTRKPLGIIP